jgi:hypothetical protein
MTRRSIRVAMALAACAIAGVAAVVGGACLPASTSPPPPQLASRPYVLTGSNVHSLPVTITDAAGRQIRVLADTLTFSTAAMTYHGSGTAAVTPAGGTAQPPAPITVSERPYSLTGLSLSLPATIGGPASATLQANAIQARMADGSFWFYVER